MARSVAERAATVAAAARLGTDDVENAPENEPGGTHSSYNRMLARAEFCRMAALGTEGYRNAYELALPRLGGESDESYMYRHGLVAAHNAFERTADAVIGFLNEQPVALSKDADPKLVEFITDVDRAGTSMAVYDEEIDYIAAIDGLAVGLVEHTRVENPGTQTEADEDRSGAGPYWLIYKLDDVLSPQYQTINGVRTLVQITFREKVTRRKGRFGREQVTKYRVYENHLGTITCEIWVTNPDGTKRIETPAFLITNQTEIPLALLPYGRRLGPFEWKPAFLDLAYLTLELYQLKNNIRNLETVACVPTRYRIGAKPDSKGKYPPMPLGTREVVEIPYPQSGVSVPAKMVGWDSPDVSVLDPAARSAIDIKGEIGSAGASFLAPDSRGTETAEAKRIDSAAQRASIHTCAVRKRDFHDKMMYFTANFLGVAPCTTVVNTNFTGEGIDPQYLAVLMTLYQDGALSLPALLAAAKTGKLPETLDAEDEAARLIAAQVERDRKAQAEVVRLAVPVVRGAVAE